MARGCSKDRRSDLGVQPHRIGGFHGAWSEPLLASPVSLGEASLRCCFTPRPIDYNFMRLHFRLNVDAPDQVRFNACQNPWQLNPKVIAFT